jgi:hypothetical protein
MAQGGDQVGGRAPRSGDHHAAAFARQGDFKFGGQHFECAAVETRVRAGTAQQHRRARPRKFREPGERSARPRQPRAVDRVQAAQQGDDIAALQKVVLGSDDQIPISGVDARIEDLHRPAAALTQ